jgi:muramidase (phage lysozyme)
MLHSGIGARIEGADYNTLVGGRKFQDDSKYPGYASGAYQINGVTYKDTARQTGAKGFDPLTQDVLAIQNMANKKALEPIMRGDFDGALKGMARGWASVPQGPGDAGYYNRAEYGNQQAKPYDEVKAIYERNLRKYLPKP